MAPRLTRLEDLIRRTSFLIDEIPTSCLLSDAIYETHFVAEEERYGRVRYLSRSGEIWPATFLGVILPETYGTRYKLTMPTVVCVVSPEKLTYLLLCILVIWLSR